MKPSLIELPERPQGLKFDLKPVADARFNVEMRQSNVEIECFGVVGIDITDARIASALRQAAQRPVTLLINSPGGDAWQGVSVYNLLSRHPAPVTVQVTGIAASAASIIAMAGSRIEMMRGAQIMVHNAWALVVGDNRAMTAAADFMSKIDAAAGGIYAARTGQPEEIVRRMMDSESFLSAEEAVALGFADAMVDGEAAERPKEKKPADARTEREFEAVLRDLGFAKAAAARLAAGAWKALKDPEARALEPAAAKMAAIIEKLNGRNQHHVD